MIASRRDVSAEQQTIIEGAFEIAERVLREVLVPRRQVITVPATASVREAVDRMLETGHSRVPVVGPSGLDTLVGVAHLRDLFDADGAVADRVHDPLFLPETLPVSDALRQLRQRRQQFAVVVNEHGDVDGIVTMEDLVEELVGEIYDETDRDVQAVVHEADGSLVVPGTFPVHDLPDVGVEPDDVDDLNVTTVAGLVLARLGRIPERSGEQADLGSHRATVLEVAGHAITRVRLTERRTAASREP
jgi:putative hemolysin